MGFFGGLWEKRMVVERAWCFFMGIGSLCMTAYYFFRGKQLIVVVLQCYVTKCYVTMWVCSYGKATKKEQCA
jgi:hypothetical protein